MFIALISWIVFGIIVGVIAKFLMPGQDGSGIIMTTLLGVGGATIGGFLASMFGYGGVDEVGGPGFIMSLILAVIGAIILLAIYRLGTGRSLKG